MPGKLINIQVKLYSFIDNHKEWILIRNLQHVAFFLFLFTCNIEKRNVTAVILPHPVLIQKLCVPMSKKIKMGKMLFSELKTDMTVLPCSTNNCAMKKLILSCGFRFEETPCILAGIFTWWDFQFRISRWLFYSIFS